MMGRSLDKIKGLRADSTRSRSVALYLLFVFISIILWLFVTFNKTITTDMEIHLNISKPSNVHFLTQVPDSLTVTVSGRGTSFFKYLFQWPELHINFADYSDGNGGFKIESTQLKKALAKEFGSLSVVSVLPVDITAHYTDLPGKSVPIMLDIEIETSPGYSLTGNIERSQDSVFVFGDSKTLKSITEVYSYHVKEVGLKDTLRRSLTISSIKGAVVEPRTIEIMVPIEKMVAKVQEIPISVRNAPDGVNVVLFPSKVEATFLVPISQYKKSPAITAVVDYNSISTYTPGNKVEVYIGEVPGAYADVKLSVDSVEYIIERHR